MTYHQPTTPELSVPALVKWLQQQNHNTDYIYQDPVLCLMGFYFAAHGSYPTETAYEQLPDYRAIAAPKPHTFGAALERAEQLLALPPPNPAFNPPGIEVREPEPAAGDTTTPEFARIGTVPTPPAEIAGKEVAENRPPPLALPAP